MSFYAPTDIREAIKAAKETINVNIEGLEKTGARLSREFSCDSRGRMPTITWTPLEEGAKSYAIISYDPDAPIGVFYHLATYNIPPNITRLTHEDLGKTTVLPNSGGRRDWYPLCPPRGHGTHRYYFLILALSEQMPVNLRSIEDLVRALRGRVLAYGWNMGTYSR